MKEWSRSGYLDALISVVGWRMSSRYTYDTKSLNEPLLFNNYFSMTLRIKQYLFYDFLHMIKYILTTFYDTTDLNTGTYILKLKFAKLQY